MRRTFLLPLIVASVVCISAPAREIAPFRTGQSTPAKEPPRDSRGKIIDELRADYDDVVNEFAKKNVNEQMRAKQQRIIDNLKRLLEEDDPPPPNGSAKPDNPPQSSPPPNGSKAKPPAPEPAPQKAPAPQPKNAQTNPPEPKQPLARQNGENVAPPRTIEELKNEKSQGNIWPPLPARQREAIDAHARDRFPPRYEELLRAYYRTIAEGARRGAKE